MSRVALPVDEHLPRLLDELRASGACVLVAPPGAGKTTRVPPALLDAGLAGEGAVVVLEPRRVAARAAAARIAEERGGRVGDEVGYHVRLDRRARDDTRLLAATYGLFLRRLAADPFLAGVGAVVLDEFHERSLDADLTLALLRRTRLEARDDLIVVVMSATLDPGPLAEYLDAPQLVTEGRLHPVEVEHRASPAGWDATPEVVRAVGDALGTTDGDVLVFLPGRGEIRRASEALSGRTDVEVVELHGDLPLDAQARALRSGPRRRVVLSTNVAETSVTVDGVTAVVDTGTARTLRFDPGRGLPVLQRVPISRASATQRSGRAGRTGPGRCIRLWPASEHRLRPERETPEVRAADVADAYLLLVAAGEADPRVFEWFEPPGPDRLSAARELLHELRALDEDRLTDRGRALADLPLPPRLGALLVDGHERGVLADAALAAALLSGRDPFRGGDALHTSESDLLDRVDALAGRPSALGRAGRGARFTQQVAKQLRAQAERVLGRSKPVRQGHDRSLRRAVLAAFPDRVARRREPDSSRGLMVGGRGVNLSPRSAVRDAAFFVCLDIGGERRGESVVHMASAVERDWLEERSSVDLAFDAEQQKVVATRRIRHLDLVLDEAPAPVRDSERAAELLAEAALDDLDSALDLSDRATSTVLARLEFLCEAMPELELPALDEETLRDLLPRLCRGKRSFEELRRTQLGDVLLSRLDWRQRQALDRHAPERIEVPSGSHVRITYERGRPPVLAVRIQEVFGWTETPRIAAGRVPLLLHLLAPNQRPQQVTDDLASFWRGAYHDVRKDLRRRYAKHAWPENPLTAQAERRPRRRR